MKVLVTGGGGFLGSNMAAEALRRGWDLTVFDDLSRGGAASNLDWLRTLGDFRFLHGDIRNSHDVESAIRTTTPDAIFHLAGQVAMTKSIEDPRRDFEINTLGSFNLLEGARRHAPGVAILYSSTNKVYGDLEWMDYVETDTRWTVRGKQDGLDESLALDFQSPYGCSKGAADQFMLDYARLYGLRTIVFRHSSMYGARQFGTFDQGWIAWFCQMALKTKRGQLEGPFTIAGDGKQVRDVLEVRDMVALYYGALEQIDKVAGQAFNIGGGMANSLSLLELFVHLERLTGARLEYVKTPPRFSDQRLFVADIGKINRAIGWSPKVGALQGLEEMLAWISAGN